MRQLILLCLGLIAGCAAAPVSLPDWKIAEREPVEVTEPLELPLLCELPWTTAECLQAIEQYELIAEGNTVIAQANADALRATESAYDALIAAGMAQQGYGQIKQQQLDVCRKDAETDKWFYRGAILAVIGLAVTQ